MCILAMLSNLDLFQMDGKINLLQDCFKEKKHLSLCFCHKVGGFSTYPVTTQSIYAIYFRSYSAIRSVKFYIHARELLSSRFLTLA